jgi:hypothetical protein
MLNPRILIAGLIVTVASFADALYGGELWDFDSTLATQRRLDEVNARDLIGALPSLRSAMRSEALHKPATYDFRFAEVAGGGAIWEPVCLDELQFDNRLPANDDHRLKDDKVGPCGYNSPACPAPVADAATYVPEEPAETRLREGEPAKMLLQAMKKVRPSVIDGTIFQDSKPIDDSEHAPLEGSDSTAIIVRCIRDLEAQAELHRMPEGAACLGTTPNSTNLPTAVEQNPDAVSALRQAGRDLEATANMLEERGLYEQADQLRGVAQEMRVQARSSTATAQSVTPYSTTSLSPMPGPGVDKDELSSDRDPEKREPKLQYDRAPTEHD